jgi:hypothetical protein
MELSCGCYCHAGTKTRGRRNTAIAPSIFVMLASSSARLLIWLGISTRSLNFESSARASAMLASSSVIDSAFSASVMSRMPLGTSAFSAARRCSSASAAHDLWRARRYAGTVPYAPCFVGLGGAGAATSASTTARTLLVI